MRGLWNAWHIWRLQCVMGVKSSVLLIVSIFALVSASIASRAQADSNIEKQPTVVNGVSGIRVIDVGELVKEAKDRTQHGDFAGALARLEEALNIEPNSAQANYAMGMLRMQLNQPDEGIRYLKRAVESAPGNYTLHGTLGVALEQVRRVDEAMEEYRRVIKLAPATPEAKEADRRMRSLQGHKYGAQGDYNAALLVFSEILRDFPNDRIALQDIGITYLALDKWGDAQASFERLVQVQPDNGLAHRYLGEVLEHDGQGAGAEAQYERALELLPTGSEVVHLVKVRLGMLRGLRYLNMGQPRQAQQEFQQVLALDPNNPLALSNLATAHHELGQPAEAEEALKRVTKVTPTNLEAQLRLGVLYAEQNRYDEAVKELEDVVSKAQGSSQAQQAGGYLARIYATPQGREIQNRLRLQRVREYKALVAREPENLGAYKSLALLYHAMGKLDDAAKVYEEIMRLDPQNSEAVFNLANVYDDLGQYTKAVETYARGMSIEKNPEVAEQIREQLRISLGKMSFADGHMEMADRQFEGIIKDRPNDIVAHSYMALIQTRLGHSAEAIKEYEEILRITGGRHMGARAALGELYEQLNREEDALAQYQWVVRYGSAGIEVVDLAKKRMESLVKQIGGFSYSLSYSLGYDDNGNLSDVNPIPEMRTDVSGGITYRRKLVGKPITWGLSVNPEYMTFHYGQYDYLRTDISPFLSWKWRGINWSGRYSYSELNGLLSGDKINHSQSLSTGATWQRKMPAVLKLFSEGQERIHVPSIVRVNVMLRDFTSETTPIYDSRTYSLGTSLNQGLGRGLAWTASYTYMDNEAKEALGDDFAYRSHGLSLELSKNFVSRIIGSIGYGYTYLGYTHPDSSTNFTRMRINQQHALTMSLSYTIKDNLRVFGSYTYQKNLSNLPTGFVLNPQDVNTAIGIQSPSLGDYSHSLLTAGISMSF